MVVNRFIIYTFQIEIDVLKTVLHNTQKVSQLKKTERMHGESEIRIIENDRKRKERKDVQTSCGI